MSARYTRLDLATGCPHGWTSSRLAGPITMRQPMPERTRATIERERLAIETAVADIVGVDDARRLIELGETLRRTEHCPDDTPSATERAERLIETAKGRARLARLTWSSV